MAGATAQSCDVGALGIAPAAGASQHQNEIRRRASASGW
jgi:hypothetical protein